MWCTCEPVDKGRVSRGPQKEPDPMQKCVWSQHFHHPAAGYAPASPFSLRAEQTFPESGIDSSWPCAVVTPVLSLCGAVTVHWEGKREPLKINCQPLKRSLSRVFLCSHVWSESHSLQRECGLSSGACSGQGTQVTPQAGRLTALTLCLCVSS